MTGIKRGLAIMVDYLGLLEYLILQKQKAEAYQDLFMVARQWIADFKNIRWNWFGFPKSPDPFKDSRLTYQVVKGKWDDREP